MQALAYARDVPRTPKQQDTIAVGLRVESDLLREIDEEAFRMSKPGAIITRTDAMKALLREALAARRKLTKK
jgi:hypothetical protein